MVRRIWLTFAFGLLAACGSAKPVPENPVLAQLTLDREHQARAVAWVHPHGVGTPVGRYALLRKGKEFCAIRFTSFRRGNDASAPTAFSTGNETFYADYDWHFQGDGSADLKKPTSRSGHAELSLKGNVGVGRLSFQRGSRTVNCGSLQLGWGYPVALSLIVVRNDVIWNRIEIAPTGWQNVEDVDGHDPALIWYRYDSKVDRTESVREIPLEQLPGRPKKTTD